jgi:hypothetical protein
MSEVATILGLTMLQLLAGLGVISWFRIWLKPAMMLSLWILTGIIIFSLIPFLLQLFYIPLTAVNIFTGLLAAASLLNIKYKTSRANIRRIISESRFRIQLYELPFLLLIVIIVFVSVWRCYYYPPTPRDLTSGAEVIAEYAVREKTMINSVFSVNLDTTNNQYKPPFITSLQIIYKYAGFYFGQIWLSSIFICFLVFLYHALSLTLHRFFAGFLLVAFLAIPEMYAYTFMALFDYSNAVFFFLAAFFVLKYTQDNERKHIALAGLFMGFATWIRSETLVLACLMGLLLCFHHFKTKKTFTNLLITGSYFIIPAIIFYIIPVSIYNKYYLPGGFNTSDSINPNLADLSLLVDRFMAVNTELLFSGQGIIYYGYFVFLFLLIFFADIAYSKKLPVVSCNWLFMVLVVYLGMPLLGYLLPLLDIDHSTKRGLFKMFPLMLLYMGNSKLLMTISGDIQKWEERNFSQRTQRETEAN